MKTWKSLLSGIFLSLALVLGLFPLSEGVSADTPPVLSISPPATTGVSPGGDFWVSVSIDQVTDLNTYQFNINYNASVVQVMGSEGGAGVTGGRVVDATTSPPTTYNIPVTWSFSPLHVPGGAITVNGNLQAGSLQGADGAGYLAQVHFQVVGAAGQTSGINPSNISMANSLGGPIAAGAAISGSVSIPWPPVTVSLSAPATVPAGGDFVARVNISLVHDFNAYQFDITYDPSIIQINSVEGGSGVTGGLIGSTPVPIDYWFYSPVGTPGTIRVLGLVPNNQAVTGSGYLAEVHFHVAGTPGQQSNLAFTTQGSFANKLFYNNVNQIPNVSWANTMVTAFASFWITTPSPLSSGEVGIGYLQTLGAYGGVTPYTWSVQSANLPGGLTLNASTGAISGTPTVVGGPTTVTFKVTDSATPPATATKDLVITIMAAPVITTASPLPAGEATAPYSQALSVSGGVSPFTWSLQGSTLPAGLTLSSGGVISGTPAAAGGPATVTVRMTDFLGGTNTRDLSITIIAGPAITSPSPLPNGEVTKAYAQVLAAMGGVSPYTWSMQGGSFPSGLTLSSAGVVSGTPTAAGSTTATVKVTDNAGGSAGKDLSITIAAAPAITSGSPLPNGEAGRNYSQALGVSGGVSPYTWTVQSGSLPAGLTLSLVGVIGGMPTTPGGSSVTISVIDGLGASAARTFSITIVAAPAITTASPLPNGQANISYSTVLAASGGVAPYAWSLQGGALPAGLSLTSATGAITGTPTAAGGPVTITVGVTDFLGGSATKDLTITIFSSPVITTVSPLPSGEAGRSYSQTLTVDGGNAPFTWSLQAGTLPNGLSFNTSTGVISGKPISASGPNTVTFKVTDIFNVTATKDLSITIVAAPAITTTSPLPTGEVGIGYSQALSVSGGLSPYTWSIASGTLPAGLTLSSGGVISGTPTAAVGPNTITLMVTDALGATVTRAVSTTIITGPAIATASPLPGGEVTKVYSQSLAATGGVSPYTWSITSGTLPAGLTLSSGGVISGTPTAAGSTTATIKVADNAGGSASKDFSITIAAAPNITTTSPLPNGEVNAPYSQALVVSGGVGPYTWSKQSGSMSSGLTLSSAGVISGTPFLAGGPTTATIIVTDGLGASTSKDFSITIVAAPIITTTSPLPAGEVGAAYSQALAVSGGVTPYTWSITSGSLPAGLTLGSSGVISGTPTAAGGPTTIIFKVTDTNNKAATKSLSITIIAAPVITTASPLPNGQAGLGYSQAIAANGGVTPYTWSIQSGTLPAGLTLSSAGVISGAPTTTGSTTANIKVTDNAGGSAINNFTITIVAAPNITTASPLPNGEVSVSYSQVLAVSGGSSPYTWSITSGSLPAGLTLSLAGTISGKPATAGGPAAATVKVTDGLGAIATRAFSITIAAAPTITTASPLPGGAVGQSYSQALAVTGGISPFNWSVQSGSLPAGLTLSSGGVISGTPTAAVGPTTVTIKATDNTGISDTRPMSITIIAAPVITTASPLPNGQAGVAYSQILAASGGTAPVTWSATGLPGGLSISPAGTISGTPSAPGDFNVAVTVTDSFVPPCSVSRSFSWHINAPVQISTSALDEVLRGKAYSMSLGSSGGTSPYTWSASGLPAGLSISPAGAISGTPTAAGNFSVNITVLDSFSSPTSASKTLTLKVYLPYDANGDGFINMGDVVKVERIILGLDPPTPAADATGNGVMDLGDIIKIERVILQLDN